MNRQIQLSKKASPRQPAHRYSKHAEQDLRVILSRTWKIKINKNQLYQNKKEKKNAHTDSNGLPSSFDYLTCP